MRVLGAGLGVVLLWASAFPAIRVASPELGVVGLSFVRLAVASLVLLAAAPFVHLSRPRRADLPLIFGCGLMGMAAYQLLLNWGELYVAAGTSSIIVASAPLVSVAIAAAAFGEPVTLLKVVGSMVAIGGVALVCLSRSDLGLSGRVWIVIGAAVVQGVYHPLTKPLLRTYTGLEVATYAMLTGTVLTAPFIAFGWHRLSSADAGAWISAGYLGLAPSALGFVLWGYAVARLPVATSTSLLYLVPAAAVVIAYVWLDEVPLVAELVGGVVVVAGVVLVGQGDRLASYLAPPSRASRHPDHPRRS
jgi:drug/metabolite transporter (DMT)-like permease